jgi:hypothetical protein
VNTEALRPDKPVQGWGGDAEANFALSRGNIELLDLGGSGRILYQTFHDPEEKPRAYPRHRAFLALNGRMAERAQVNFINQGFAHLRWTWMMHRRVGPEFFAQYQFNQFLRLQTRALGGGGVRVDAVHGETWQLWGGTGYMMEFNRINVDPSSGADPPETLEHRWASYAALRASFFEDRLRFQDTLYVQPRFDRLSDLRVLNDAEVSAKITERFSLGTSFSLLHDSAPPSGVRPTDLRLVSNLRVSF